MTLEEFLNKGTRKGFIKLNIPTDDNVEISLVKKRPFIGERDDFGDKEYKDMRFDNSDNVILLSVQKRNPIYGKHYRKRLVKKKPQ